MNVYLEQLVELSLFDKQIDDFEPRLKEVQKDLIAKQGELAEIEEKISTATNEIDELKAQIVATNIHIKEFGTKIKEISKKFSQIKSEKESKALKIEEDVTKEQLDAANDDISKYEKLIENKNSLKTELSAKKTELLAQIEESQKASKTEIDTIEKERKKVYQKKEKLTSEMNQSILSFYEKIRKWAKNTAVVKLKKQACYGCFMKINDKTYISVLKGDDIITCPHCGRILYADETSKE